MAVCPAAHCVPGLLHAHCAPHISGLYAHCALHIWAPRFYGCLAVPYICDGLLEATELLKGALEASSAVWSLSHTVTVKNIYVCRTVFRLESKYMYMSPALTTIVAKERHGYEVLCSTAGSRTVPHASVTTLASAHNTHCFLGPGWKDTTSMLN